jgi:predicted RNase H-like HicB family nuclease
MEKREFNLIIEKDEDGYYTSEVIGLSGCHTQAKSMDELIKRTKEAIELYLECQNEEDRQENMTESFIGIQKLVI